MRFGGDYGDSRVTVVGVCEMAMLFHRAIDAAPRDAATTSRARGVIVPASSAPMIYKHCLELGLTCVFRLITV